MTRAKSHSCPLCRGSLGSQSGAAVVMMPMMGSDDEGGPEDNNIKQTAVCVPTPTCLRWRCLSLGTKTTKEDLQEKL